MTLANNHFEQLYFTDCNFEPPLILNSKIVITTHKLGIVPGHPLNPTNEMIFLPKCYLVFDGVKKSVRQLTGYIEYPPGSRNFKPLEENSRTIVDDSFTQINQDATLFGLEGVFEHPLEWVDWEIESVSFCLMEDSSYRWEFIELWIDKTAFPPHVLVLLGSPEGISCVYEPAQNYQMVFFSFTYEEAKVWLLENKYERVEQRFKSEKVA